MIKIDDLDRFVTHYNDVMIMSECLNHVIREAYLIISVDNVTTLYLLLGTNKRLTMFDGESTIRALIMNVATSIDNDDFEGLFSIFTNNERLNHSKERIEWLQGLDTLLVRNKCKLLKGE